MTSSPNSAVRNVVVTGARGDIGSAIVGSLLRAGTWRVAAIDRTAVEPADDGVLSLTCDLTDREATDAAISDVTGRLGAPYALINCVGHIANAPAISFVDGRLVAHDAATWDQVIAANLTATFNACVATARVMVESRTKGVLINFGSVAARGNPGQVAYAAAKAGVVGLTRTLAREFSGFGIRVVCVAPGFFDTPSTRKHVPESRLKTLASSTAQKRLGRVEELASAVDFILTNEYFNGSVLELDGGLQL
jgi:3-oxoacyl-[acyl-carrier protein] reductase